MDSTSPTEDKQAFIAALVRDHGQRLRRYLAARLRNDASAVPDLAQEVYLRMLRMPRHETIRSPQAYLFTVAHHVLYEHRMTKSAVPEALQMTDALAEMESYVEEDPSTHLDTRRRLEELDRALKEISPRAHATFVLHRRYGFSLEEIASHLGVSRGMVKKYLAKAITHCKSRFDGMK
jgi:RNA polymerase sigma-70 factor (ECF subfamily)